MSEEERAAFLQRAALKRNADQARDAAIAVLRGDGDSASLSAQLDAAAERVIEGEAEGSAWHELADYYRALAAVLRREAVQSVPAAYIEHFVAVQRATSKDKE